MGPTIAAIEQLLQPTGTVGELLNEPYCLVNEVLAIATNNPLPPDWPVANHCLL